MICNRLWRWFRLHMQDPAGSPSIQASNLGGEKPSGDACQRTGPRLFLGSGILYISSLHYMTKILSTGKFPGIWSRTGKRYRC